MEAQYGAISVGTESVQVVSDSWVQDLKSIATGLAFTALLAVAGTVLVTFALLAAWVFAPVIAVGIAVAVHRVHRRRHQRHLRSLA